MVGVDLNDCHGDITKMTGQQASRVTKLFETDDSLLAIDNFETKQLQDLYRQFFRDAEELYMKFEADKRELLRKKPTIPIQELVDSICI